MLAERARLACATETTSWGSWGDLTVRAADESELELISESFVQGRASSCRLVGDDYCLCERLCKSFGELVGFWMREGRLQHARHCHCWWGCHLPVTVDGTAGIAIPYLQGGRGVLPSYNMGPWTSRRNCSCQPHLPCGRPCHNDSSSSRPAQPMVSSFMPSGLHQLGWAAAKGGQDRSATSNSVTS